MAKATYKDAGVDLEVYRQSMARLPRLLHRTYSPRVIKLDGGFAGLFQLDFASPLFARRYENPVLVSCTDGVGTKLKVASSWGPARHGRHRPGGDERQRRLVLRGRAAVLPGLRGHVARRSGAAGADRRGDFGRLHRGRFALLGGETAIMPDLYARGDYDLAGFCVGVA